MQLRPQLAWLAVLALPAFAAVAVFAQPSAPQPQPPEQAVAIAFKTAPKGTVYSEKSKAGHSLNIKVTVNGNLAQNLDQAQAVTKAHTVTVLESNDTAITKAKVKIDAHSEITTRNGTAGPEDKGQEGKTFILEFKDGKLAVTNEDGSAVSEVVAAALRKEFRSVGQKDPMAEMLGKEPIKVGQAIDMSKSEAAKRILGGDDEGSSKIEKFTLTLKGTHTENNETLAIFALELEIENSPSGITIHMATKGEMQISTTTGMVRRVNFSGPMTGASQQGQALIDVDGTMEFAVEAAVQASK